MTDLSSTALVVVDVQKAFDDAAHWGRRNNPACEANIEALIGAWRAAGGPVVFVRHEFDTHEWDLKDTITGEPDLLVSKTVHSAFYGDPDLDGWLRSRGLGAFAVCGITTDHCVETTARMGGDLGYDVLVVLDATHTFDRTAPDGTVVTADELARATATSLHEEFATVVSTAEVVGSAGELRH
ncbi:MAG TPA: isochorismatase family protein [Solirubrobacteraceae bacterium]|nr:isochorismatase family protein [Solirubrobacteraceae bacterium]